MLIDPSVMITGEYSTQDSYVCDRYPNANYYLNTYLRTGRDADFYIRRTYLRFNIPDSVMNHTVTDAYINIHKSSGAAPVVTAYRVTGSWSSSSITWNNMPGYTTTNASTVSTATSNGWHILNVTQIVAGWTQQVYSNYGFVLKDATESGTTQWTTFHSSDAASPNKPELHITYQAPVIIDRMSATFAENTMSFAADLQYKMNCYGYMLQVYCKDGVQGNPYKQVPGEFEKNNVLYNTLFTNYLLHQSSPYTAADFLEFVKANMLSDFGSLQTDYGGEWIIEDSTETEVVPTGYRKGVLTIGLNDVRTDFHFYMRHEDGTWSHKQGATSISNQSIDSHVVRVEFYSKENAPIVRHADCHREVWN